MLNLIKSSAEGIGHITQRHIAVGQYHRTASKSPLLKPLKPLRNDWIAMSQDTRLNNLAAYFWPASDQLRGELKSYGVFND